MKVAVVKEEKKEKKEEEDNELLLRRSRMKTLSPRRLRRTLRFSDVIPNGK